MSNNRLIVRLLAPLAVALFVVAITIGLSQPTLVETANGNVVCASAFGTGDTSGATETGQASCAALTSERQMWSFSLLGVGLGLLAGVFWVALSTSTRPGDQAAQASYPPAPAQWVDYPATGPVPGTGPGPVPGTGTGTGPAGSGPAEPPHQTPETR